MLTIDEDADVLRFACESCGAHITLARSEHESLLKRQDQLECEVCGTREPPPALPAAG